MLSHSPLASRRVASFVPRLPQPPVITTRRLRVLLPPRRRYWAYAASTAAAAPAAPIHLAWSSICSLSFARRARYQETFSLQFLARGQVSLRPALPPSKFRVDRGARPARPLENMVACPAKHPMHPTSNCYKKAIVRACCDRLREIEGRLEQSVGPRFEQQLQSCEDLCGVARLILMLQRRTELRDSDSVWLEARSRPPTKPTPEPSPSPKPAALPPRLPSHPDPGGDIRSTVSAPLLLPRPQRHLPPMSLPGARAALAGRARREPVQAGAPRPQPTNPNPNPTPTPTPNPTPTPTPHPHQGARWRWR